MKKFFSKYNDEDFFSNKFTHIYFNSEVSNDSVLKLQQEILYANKTVTGYDGVSYQPKPIVIHISSPGGDLIHGMKFLSIFKESNVPICTLIDNYSASASTILSIGSPYRLIVEHGYSLIHQYNLFMIKKRNDVLESLNNIENTYKEVLKLYLKKTKFNKKELKELLEHDLWLNSETNLKYGLVDRVIKIKTPVVKKVNIPIDILMKKTNYNNLYITCDNNIEEFNNLLLNDIENLKPLIIYSAKSSMCFYDDKIQMNSIFSLIPRIQCLKTPSYFILNVDMSLDDYLPMLYCTMRYMYSHINITCSLLYYKNNSLLIQDAIINTNTILIEIKKILKQKTKLPNDIIDNIDKKIITLNAKQCLKYGLCDKIINI